MKKNYYHFKLLMGMTIGTLLSIGSAHAQNSYEASNPHSIERLAKVSKAKSGEVLWNNTNISAIPSGIVSTELGGLPQGSNRTNTADDFVIAASAAWTIDSVYAEGFSNDSAGIDSIRVIIYDDLNNTPNAEISNQLIANSSSGNDSAFTLKLPNPVALTGGKYWISIMAAYDTTTNLANGRWNWLIGSTPIGSDWHLQDKAMLFGTNTNWQSASSIGLSPSCYFSLHGTVDQESMNDIGLVDVLSFEYAESPMQHTDSVSFAAVVYNNGVNNLTDVHLRYSLMQGSSVVYRDSSNSINLNGMDTIVLFSDDQYKITSPGEYYIEYDVVFENTDVDFSNNVILSDTTTVTSGAVFARDNGIQSGSLGIGVGEGLTGILGQTFTLLEADTLTTISFFISNGSTGSAVVGEDIYAEIYSFDGTPLNMLAVSDTSTITTTGPHWVHLGISNEDKYLVLPAGTFYIGLVEGEDFNMTLGTSSQVFTPGAGWVNFSGSGGWVTSEALGFPVAYMLRANFDNANTVGLPSFKKPLSDVSLFPNPTDGKLTLTIDTDKEMGETTISILNITGQEVYSESFDMETQFHKNINLENLPAGTYMMNIESSEYQTVKKVILE